jgi:hypothetical protein
MVELLPTSGHEALSSNPVPPPKKPQITVSIPGLIRESHQCSEMSGDALNKIRCVKC